MLEIIKKNFLQFLFFLITTITVIFIITVYCELFYNFGNYAKNRITQNKELIFIITPFCFWLSAFLCKKYANGASGSNMINIQKTLNQLKDNPDSYNKKICKYLSFKVAIISIISSLIATFGGGSLGREGPSIQISASIFTWLGNKFKKYLNKISFENLVYSGSALGFAIAFSSPISAIIYIIEKLINIETKRFFRNLVFSLLTILVMSFFINEFTPIYKANKINFEISKEFFIHIQLAVICSIIGFALVRISLFFYNKLFNINSKFWHLIPITIGIIVASIALYGGVYSIGGGIKTVNDALQNNNLLLSFESVFGRILTTMLTFIAGCSGGLIAPAIAIGAGISSLFALLPTIINVKFLIICGMSSFLSAVINMPFVSAFVIIESSKQSFTMYPYLLIITLTSSYLVKFLIKTKSIICEKYLKRT